jgi:hypothetical protein
MKKTIARKLALSKETLRNLRDTQLGNAAGGIGPSDLPEDSCVKSCFCDTTK